MEVNECFTGRAVGAHPVGVAVAEARVRAVGSVAVALIWALGSGHVTQRP